MFPKATIKLVIWHPEWKTYMFSTRVYIWSTIPREDPVTWTHRTGSGFWTLGPQLVVTLGSWGAFRRWSLDGAIYNTGGRLWGFIASSYFQFTLPASCLWLTLWSPMSYSPPLPPASKLPSRSWTDPLELEAKITFLKSLWFGYFNNTK